MRLVHMSKASLTDEGAAGDGGEDKMSRIYNIIRDYAAGLKVRILGGPGVFGLCCLCCWKSQRIDRIVEKTQPIIMLVSLPTVSTCEVCGCDADGDQERVQRCRAG